MEPGWLVLLVFMFVECLLVTLLVMPMPSNKVRGAVTAWVSGLWDVTFVRYAFTSCMALDAFYLYFVFDALLHPLYDIGLLTPIETDASCEQRASRLQNERNAYITGFSLFLFFILRRLLDIQAKLHEARGEQKASSGGVPMGEPVAAQPAVQAQSAWILPPIPHPKSPAKPAAGTKSHFE